MPAGCLLVPDVGPAWSWRSARDASRSAASSGVSSAMMAAAAGQGGRLDESGFLVQECEAPQLHHLRFVQEHCRCMLRPLGTDLLLQLFQLHPKVLHRLFQLPFARKARLHLGAHRFGPLQDRCGGGQVALCFQEQGLVIARVVFHLRLQVGDVFLEGLDPHLGFLGPRRGLRRLCWRGRRPGRRRLAAHTHGWGWCWGFAPPHALRGHGGWRLGTFGRPRAGFLAGGGTRGESPS